MSAPQYKRIRCGCANCVLAPPATPPCPHVRPAHNAAVAHATSGGGARARTSHTGIRPRHLINQKSIKLYKVTTKRRTTTTRTRATTRRRHDGVMPRECTTALRRAPAQQGQHMGPRRLTHYLRQRTDPRASPADSNSWLQQLHPGAHADVRSQRYQTRGPARRASALAPSAAAALASAPLRGTHFRRLQGCEQLLRRRLRRHGGHAAPRVAQRGRRRGPDRTDAGAPRAL